MYQQKTLLTPQLFFSTIQFILSILSDGSEVGQNPHELEKIDPIIMAICEKRMYNPFT